MAIFSDSQPALKEAGPSFLRANAPHARRVRRATLHPDVLAGNFARGDRLVLDAFADLSVTAVVDRVSTDVNGTLAVRARTGAGTVLLTLSGSNFYGSVVLPDSARQLNIRHLARQSGYWVEELDPKNRDFLDGAPSVAPEVTPAAQPVRHAAKTSATTNRLDILVVYTPDANGWATTNAGGINTVIAQAIQIMQDAADRCDLGISYNLVHAEQISYNDCTNIYTTLNRLAAKTDGFMDEVHTIRDNYGADLVTLFSVEHEYGGLGYLMGGLSGYSEYALNVVRVQQVHTSHTLDHEVGHNMGAHHRKDQEGGGPGPGLFAYSAGWRWLGTNGTRYCSIMSYTDAWDGNPVYQSGYYSSPQVVFMGGTTGNDSNDNARTLCETKAAVAAYRASPSDTRIVRLSGTPCFGHVTAGESAQQTLTIHNDGNSPLAVSSISYPSGYSGAWNGTVAASNAQAVTVTFSPSAPGAYNGTVTVNSDATAGTSTWSVFGTGVAVNTFFVLITNPAPDTVTVSSATATYLVQGRCTTSVVGGLTWTNRLTGGNGTTAAATNWGVSIGLGTGTNLITLTGTNRPAPGGTLAQDSASNSVYNDSWATGDNGGSGFGAWTLGVSGSAGHFRATKASNPNLATAPTAWGMWANSEGTASAYRDLGTPLAVGHTLLVKFENKWITTAKSVGIALRNSANEYLVEFLFEGGDANYTINDETLGRDTGIAYTTNGFTLYFDLTGASSYRVRVGGMTMTGTLKTRSNMAPSRFAAWNFSAGSGSEYNFYLADLAITNASTPAAATNDTVAIIRAAAEGSAPGFVTQPAGTLVYAGERTTLSASATGTPVITYQWFRNGSPHTAGTNALAFNPAQTADAGAYFVVATNAFGAATSQTAALIVSNLAGQAASHAGAAGYVIQWPGLADRTYDVYYSTNLLAPNAGFVPLLTNLTGTTVTDLVHQSVDQLYYRIRSSRVTGE